MISVLFIEDSSADFKFFSKVLESLSPSVKVTALEKGNEALFSLRQIGKFIGTPPPDLIFLDLNIPIIDGRDLLKEIKQDSALRHIPLIVLSGSENHSDILECYRRGANAYHLKSESPEELKSIAQYWIQRALFLKDSKK